MDEKIFQFTKEAFSALLRFYREVGLLTQSEATEALKKAGFSLSSRTYQNYEGRHTMPDGDEAVEMVAVLRQAAGAKDVRLPGSEIEDVLRYQFAKDEGERNVGLPSLFFVPRAAAEGVNRQWREWLRHKHELEEEYQFPRFDSEGRVYYEEEAQEKLRVAHRHIDYELRDERGEVRLRITMVFEVGETRRSTLEAPGN